MLDSEASHNLMPKAVMEKLGLDVTRKYHDLYSFDSSRVHCIGLIKYLVVSLDQIPAKNVLMDVVVPDVPPRFGMLLSRSWGEKLKGTIQLDFSYATIPVFGQLRKLYREKEMKYMITSKDKPVNHPIIAVHTDLESFILYSDGGLNDEDVQLVQVEEIPKISENFREVLKKEKKKAASTSKPPACQQKKDSEQPEISQGEKKEETKFQHLQEEEEGLWGMDFDGAVGKDGAGIGI